MVAEADVFIASLIFICKIWAQKVVEAGRRPHRGSARRAAVVLSPPCGGERSPTKLGTFSMAQLARAKSAIASFMKKRRRPMAPGFQDGDVETASTPCPTVLNISAGVEKAQDARPHAQLSSIGLGERRDNLRNLAVMLADKYVFPKATLGRPALEGGRTGVFPESGASGTPWRRGCSKNLKEYLNWNSSRADLSERQGRVR